MKNASVRMQRNDAERGGFKDPAARGRQGLSKKQRLRDSAAFREAFRSSRPLVGRYIVLRERRGPGASLRLGVIVSKRTLRRSPDRSRARRLVREAYRLNRHRFKPDRDIVIIARKSILDVSRPAVDDELLRLARKGGLLR